MGVQDGNSEFLQAVVAVARTLPAQTTEEVATALDGLDTPPSASKAASILAIVSKASSQHRLERLFKRWSEHVPGLPPTAVAWALRGASASDLWHRESQKLELVWTGPAPHGTSLRRNDQALLELVSNAKKSITLVTFTAYKLEALQAALLSAAERGVDVHLVLEMTESGKVTFDPKIAFGPELVAKSTVWVWPLEQRPKDDNGHHGTLHAKLALADEKVLLVSSANLTGFAMETNMEMGLLVTGGALPRQVASHLSALFASGVLEAV